MKQLLLVLPLVLAACGSASETSPPPQSEGTALRAQINRTTVDYADCVKDAVQNVVDGKDKLASIMADEAFAACRPRREQLLADVLKFRRLGNPSEPEANSKVTAEQSVLNLDADLREQVLIMATQRRLADENGKNAAN